MLEQVNDTSLHFSIQDRFFNKNAEVLYSKSIMKTRLWCHNYAMLKDLIFLQYFSVRNISNQAILKILETLYDQSLFEEIYQFLIKIVETLAK